MKFHLISEPFSHPHILVLAATLSVSYSLSSSYGHQPLSYYLYVFCQKHYVFSCSQLLLEEEVLSLHAHSSYLFKKPSKFHSNVEEKNSTNEVKGELVEV